MECAYGEMIRKIENCSNFLRILSICLAVFFLLPVLTRAETWNTAESAHFVVFGAGSKTKVTRLSHEFEAVHAVLEDWLLTPSARSMPALILYLESEQDLQEFKVSQLAPNRDINGLSVGPAMYPAIVIPPNMSREESLRTIYHEYAHVVLGRLSPHAPLWLEEGVAECMETLRIDSQGYRLGCGHKGALSILAQNELLPLEEFFRISYESQAYKDPAIRSVFLAQCWALVNVCMFGEDPRNWERLVRFSRSMTSNADLAPEFERCFGFGLREMERKVRALVKRGNVPGVYVSKPQPNSVVKLREAKSSEVQAAMDVLTLRMLGDVFAPGAMSRTSLCLQRILETDNPFLLELGVLGALDRGEYAAAKAMAKKIQDSARFRPLVAMRLLDVEMQHIGLNAFYRMPEDLTRTMRVWVDAGRSNDQQAPDFLRAAAFVEAFSEGPRTDLLRLLEKSESAMEPYASEISVLLALRSLRDKNPAACLARLKRYPPSETYRALAGQLEAMAALALSGK